MEKEIGVATYVAKGYYDELLNKHVGLLDECKKLRRENNRLKQSLHKKENVKKDYVSKSKLRKILRECGQKELNEESAVTLFQNICDLLKE